MHIYPWRVARARGGGKGICRRGLHVGGVILLSAFLSFALSAVGSCESGAAPPTKPPPKEAGPPAQARALTLEAAIAEALEANPNIKSAAHQARARHANAAVARGLRWGEMDAVATAQHLNEDEMLKPLAGPITPAAMSSIPFADDQLHFGAEYTVPLYLAGRITNQVGIAEYGAEQGEALLDSTRWSIRYAVAARFAQAQSLDAKANAIQGEMDALNQTRRRLELELKVGKAAEVDLLKVMDQLDEARAEKTKTLAARREALARLLSLLGRDPGGEIELTPLPERVPSLTVSEEELKEMASHRTSVRMAELALSQGRRKVSLARGALFPAVYLQANYLRHADLSETDISYDTWQVGVRVSLPVFDGMRRLNEVSRSKEQARGLEQQLEMARLQASADLEAALADWSAAHEQWEAAKSRAKYAAEVARVEQIKYDTGAGDIEDLLRARAREAAARSAESAARSQIIVSGEEINRVVESKVVQ